MESIFEKGNLKVIYDREKWNEEKSLAKQKQVVLLCIAILVHFMIVVISLAFAMRYHMVMAMTGIIVEVMFCFLALYIGVETIYIEAPKYFDLLDTLFVSSDIEVELIEKKLEFRIHYWTYTARKTLKNIIHMAKAEHYELKKEYGENIKVIIDCMNEKDIKVTVEGCL